MVELPDKDDCETAAEFLKARANWLQVQAVDNEHGTWSVVLRLDGYYSIDHGTKAEMVRHFQERVLGVFYREGIPFDLLHDWVPRG